MLDQIIEDEAIVPQMTLLNSTGDITLQWAPEDEDSVLPLIEKKMAEGYSFFVLKPRKVLPGQSKKRAKDIAAIRAAGNVVIPDELAQEVFRKTLGDADVEAAVSAGHAQVVSSGSGNRGNFETVRRTKSAREVAKNQTMALRPIVGG